jgi:membrane protease YdiL (CAAX protease family)
MASLPGSTPAVGVVPLVLLGVAAAFRPARLPVLAILAGGFVASRTTGRGQPSSWAGSIPVAVSLAWGLMPLPPAATDGSTCTDPLAPFATWRVAEATVTLATVAMLIPLVGGGGGGIGLRRPSRGVACLAIAAFALSGPAGIVLGPGLAAPFFGTVDMRLEVAAIIPAAAFALSNGCMEEIAYRGCLQCWTGRSTGPVVSIAGQAIVFGLAHAAGPDVDGDALALWAAMTAGGLAAGTIAWRTGSLAIPIAIHVGLDLPLYLGNACRAR